MSRRNPANGPLMQSPESRPGSSGTPTTLRPPAPAAKSSCPRISVSLTELSTTNPHQTPQPRKSSGPQDDLLLIGRQLDIQANVFAYPIPEGRCRIRIAVDHEYGLWTPV